MKSDDDVAADVKLIKQQEEDEEDGEKKTELEDTIIYKLIERASESSLANALQAIRKSTANEIRQRSNIDSSTFLHAAVNSVQDVVRRTGDASSLIPLLYALALRGVTINAQNIHGNTALHLACLKPQGQRLYEHLIRIGSDPMIVNKKNCRCIHTFKGHKCVLVKGQTTAKCGLWKAVECEDIDLTEKLLKSWCRIRIRKNNKTLRDICDQTCNMKLLQLFDKYELRNEIINTAFSLDSQRLNDLLKIYSKNKKNVIQQSTTNNYNIKINNNNNNNNNNYDLDDNDLDDSDDDPSYTPSKPLIISLKELLGKRSEKVISILERKSFLINSKCCRSDKNICIYYDRLNKQNNGLESTELYTKIMTATKSSLNEALLIVRKINFQQLQLLGGSDQYKGFTYLHLIVKLCAAAHEKDLETRRLFIRILYALCRRDVDVNIRNAQGNTALILAGKENDEELMIHCLRIGIDPNYKALDGCTVSEQIYEDRGALIYGRRYNTQHLPGLWSAVELGDLKKAKRWLSTWSRVRIKKGDRSLIEYADTMKRDDIKALLIKYQHVNEFVAATFSCDLKAMKDLLALGNGSFKVNTLDDYFHIGLTWDGHAEFLPRPIIVAALEQCTSDVIAELVRFGADLSKDYAQRSPCGPLAFWAFRDDIDNENTLIIAKTADLKLRDEFGSTLLHRAIGKGQQQQRRRRHVKTADDNYDDDNNYEDDDDDDDDDKKKLLLQVVAVLLDRGIDLAARDYEGSTARDLIDINCVHEGNLLKQMIDDRIMELVNNEQIHSIEQLLLDDYDFILQAKGGKKRILSALELAELRNFKELVELLKDLPAYRKEIDLLHDCVKKGDLQTISKLAAEKRSAYGKDKAGRSLLHNAVLYERLEIVDFLLEQFPLLINDTDSLKRTPLHYCVCLKERQRIWPSLQDAGADPNAIDANNMSVYDYVRDQETPIPTKDRPKGRRFKDYRPGYEMIETERRLIYGGKAAAYSCFVKIKPMIVGGNSINQLKSICQSANLLNGFNYDNLSNQLLKLCLVNNRTELAKYFIKEYQCSIDQDLIDKAAEKPANDEIFKLFQQEYQNQN